MDSAFSANGKNKNAYRILVGKPEGKRKLGRQRRRSVNDMKIGLRGIEWGITYGIDLLQNRNQWRAFVNTVIEVRVP
jgi:hypothetical protein